MESLRNIKPVYLYLISGVFFIISQKMKNGYPILYYLSIFFGIGFFIWALGKYFKR